MHEIVKLIDKERKSLRKRLYALDTAEKALNGIKMKGETKVVRTESGAKLKIKHKMSAAGRKAIGDATRKRWAEFHKKNGKS